MCDKNQTTSIKAFKLKTDKKSGKLILTKLLDKNIEKVVLPDDVDVIGEDAFKNAKNLKEIVLNDGLSVIDEDAFCGCTSLLSIAIPSSVTVIEEDTFHGCTALTSIVIPASITYIDEDAFYGCEKLEKVVFLGSEEQWKQIKIEQPNDCLLKATVEYKK